MKSINDAFASNLQNLLTKIAQVVIEEQGSFSEFSELAKRAFVTAAEKVLHDEKRVTDSRISIITGIHRKDVKKFRSHVPHDSTIERSSSNRAIAVISAWNRDSLYQDEAGEPIPLPYDGEAPSLASLVKDFSGDMPLRAVRDELIRLGVIEERKGRWHLTLPAYVPNKSRDALFEFLGNDTSHLVETIRHNLKHTPNERRFQRSVAYDELAPETVAEFKAYASERSMDLLKEFDSWLSKREGMDKNNRRQDPTLTKILSGIGIYYFEQSPANPPEGDNS